MTPGSRPWVVRSLRDWALSVRQGMALATYRSGAARDLTLRDLTLEFQANRLTAETLECGGCTAEDFVSRIGKSEAGVLFVLDPDRLLFGESGDRSPFWVNFHRETLAAHPGVQIWWMLPSAAIRFGQELPDLSRFFLFREDLTDKVEVERDASLELQVPRSASGTGDPDRARDLLERALRAAASSNADPARVWLELGIPAIDEFLRSGQPSEGLTGLRQLTVIAGVPEAALKRAAASDAAGDAGRAFLTLSRLYRELGMNEDGLAAAEQSVLVYRQLAQQRPGAFLPNLAISLNNAANRLGDLGRREEALEQAEEAVRIRRQLAKQNSDAFLPDLAGSLNNLANRLADVCRREEAAALAQEAVRIRRQLAQLRPAAFLPDLARSLAVLGRILATDRPTEAMEPLAEGLRILAPLFYKLPPAHGRLMQTIYDQYLRAAESANIVPDMALLAPVAAVLEKLNSSQSE